MGVKTSVWGRYAWLVLEGVASTYDDFYMRFRFERPEEMRQLKELTTTFFFLVGFVVPCIYCRISYRSFTEPSTSEPGLDIRMHLEHGKARLLVYNLHNRVSRKLRGQELEKAQGAQAKAEVRKRWAEKSITFKQALKTKFPSMNSERFWNAAVVFLALVMCDYRPEDCLHIHNFYILIGKVLAITGPPDSLVPNAYLLGLKQTLPLWCSSAMDSLDGRLDIVWALKRAVFSVQGWTFRRSRASFAQQCRRAIVGCQPT